MATTETRKHNQRQKRFERKCGFIRRAMLRMGFRHRIHFTRMRITEKYVELVIQHDGHSRYTSRRGRDGFGFPIHWTAPRIIAWVQGWLSRRQPIH